MISIKRRVFLIVLDSFGIGEMPDAKFYLDEGSNTLKAVMQSKFLKLPYMKKLGLFNIDGADYGYKEEFPIGSFARMTEASKGKDTTIGHWEIAGIKSDNPLPTYPNGFDYDIIKKFEKFTGKNVLCNKPYSGTSVIKDYGKEHLETGNLIVYTSADSVFQIAAHEDIISINKLYEYCKVARQFLVGKHGVGRVIARPFKGKYPNFERTSNRHDFSLEPPKKTMLDYLVQYNKTVIAIGKISDIFAGRGISQSIRTINNDQGIKETLKVMKKSFNGICFINLVDFDMIYGHRNDVDGYAKALSYFDDNLNEIMCNLNENDMLMITADHGCDPSTESTDHSREYTPLLIYGHRIKTGLNLGTRSTFSDIAATILDYFDIKEKVNGESFLSYVLN